jgi:predicted enzyme related to lactoylglutathione lyase
MLAKTTVTTMLPVSDPERARHFYADQLGLHEAGAGSDGTRYFEVADHAALGLRPAPAGVQSPSTVLTFEVSNIESEITDLERRGVHFEDYDTGDYKTVNHIANLGDERAAWFTDSEGNILCLHQGNNRNN